MHDIDTTSDHGLRPLTKHVAENPYATAVALVAEAERLERKAGERGANKAVIERYHERAAELFAQSLGVSTQKLKQFSGGSKYIASAFGEIAAQQRSDVSENCECERDALLNVFSCAGCNAAKYACAVPRQNGDGVWTHGEAVCAERGGNSQSVAVFVFNPHIFWFSSSTVIVSFSNCTFLFLVFSVLPSCFQKSFCSCSLHSVSGQTF